MGAAAIQGGGGRKRSIVLETRMPMEEDASLKVFADGLVQRGERVVWLDVPGLLSDRVSISRGVLRALFAAEGGQWLSLLRDVVPRGHDPARWFENHTDLSAGGSRRVAEALVTGDYRAIEALVARANPDPEHFNGDFHVPPPPPLGERDALSLLVAMLGKAQSAAPLWCVAGGLEEALGAECPWAEPFARGWGRWWRGMLAVDGPALIATCWRGALGGLGRLEPGLVPASVEPRPLPPLEPEAVVRGAAQALGLSEVRRDGSVWRAEGPAGLWMFVWPSEARDPAGELVARVGAVVGAMAEPGSIEVVYPRWAGGQARSESRRALSHAFPKLVWSPADRRALSVWREVATGESVG